MGLGLAQLELARDHLRDLHDQAARLEVVVDTPELHQLGAAVIAHEHQLKLRGAAQVPGRAAVGRGVIARHDLLSAARPARPARSTAALDRCTASLPPVIGRRAAFV